MDFVPGQQIGSYRIVRPLGRGGMGAVYEVEHVKLGVRYGLKTYTLADGHAELFRKRFQTEGRVLARLRHPNLVRVFDLDYDETSGALYYVMDLVRYKDGESYTLDDVEDGGVDEEHIREWFAELCDALAYVHGEGVVHRDIKLNNILLAPGRQVVLSDFGISRIVDDKLRADVELSRTMVSGAAGTGKLIMGTEGYMAPEVLRGEDATPSADVYALGVVFFKLLTGVWYDASLSPKVRNATTGKMDAVRLLEHFEYNWKDVLPRMLSADPTERPVDLRALAAELKRSPETVETRRVGWFGWLVLAAAVAVGVGAVVWWRGSGGSETNDVQDKEAVLDAAFDIPESLK